MQIKIPRRAIKVWDAFGDWSNVEVVGWVRRLDIIVAIGALPCIGWYAYTDGWLGALGGALMYVLVCMCALWFF
jgi:hypothetical protein